MAVDRQAYLIDLLKQDSAGLNESHSQFLKKFILLCGLGEFRINGQAPNKAFTLADYLLDGYRTMVDWSRLSRKQEQKLKKWLFVKEQSSFHTRLFSPYRVSEIRGRPEEIRLGFWERLYQALYFQRRYYTVPFRTDFIPDTYTLKEIDIALSRQGALIDLVPRIQLLSKEVLKTTEEYQDEGQQNVKRLILTDEMVETLVSTPLKAYDFEGLINKPHAHAIESHYPIRRLFRMREYRRNNQYHYRPNLFLRLYRYVLRWFRGVLPQTNTIHKHRHVAAMCVTANNQNKTCEHGFTKIATVEDKEVFLEKISIKDEENSDKLIDNGEVYITEPRPPVSVFVFSGGGAKIFGHVGAIKKVHEHGIRANIFAGSSSGAIIAMLLYIGYTPEEIEDEFGYISDDILIDVDVQRAGISTTRNLKGAIDYMVLNKIQKIVKRYPKRFESGDGALFLAKYFNETTFTFRALAQLRKICPEAGIGEGLFVTGSDVTVQERKIFSLETTPDIEIAEAVKISGSMPVLYHPTDLDGHVFTDGGCMENTPVGLEGLFKKTKTLIDHELAANLNVLAFQFDNGVETDVIHSAKPVYRENYLLNKIYEWATRVKDPATWWVRERRGLRKYACQTIIIKTDGVKASKFNIDDSVRDKLKEFGVSGATEYIVPRFNEGDKQSDELNEKLYKRFENLEELIYYCAYREEWAFLNKLMSALSEHRPKLNADYLSKLQSIRWRLLEENRRQHQQNHSPRNETKYKPLFNERSTRVDEAHEHAGLYCLLYSLLVCPWEALAQQVDSVRPVTQELVSFRNSVIENKQKRIFYTFNEMCHYFEEMRGETHILLYMLKVLLVHAQGAAISDVEEDLQGMRQIMSRLVEFNSIIDKSRLVGDWSFGLEKTQALIKFLSERKTNKMEDFLNIIQLKGYKNIRQVGLDEANSQPASNEEKIVDDAQYQLHFS